MCCKHLYEITDMRGSSQIAKAAVDSRKGYGQLESMWWMMDRRYSLDKGK